MSVDKNPNTQLQAEVHQHLTDLTQIMNDMISVQSRLLSLNEHKRVALSRADREALAGYIHQEHEQVHLLTELEKRRLLLIGDITLILNPQAEAPLKLTELAEYLPEPMRSRLLLQRQELREKVQAVREASRVSQRATETLLQHMQGLMQAVGQVVSGVSTYGSRGAVPQTSMGMSTFSVSA